MNYHAYRRRDGVLVGLMSTPELPTVEDQQAEVNKLTLAYGDSWQWVSLNFSQFSTALTALQANKAAIIIGGEIAMQGPPALTANKTQISADDTEQATMTISAGSSTVSGRYLIRTPEGNEESGLLNLSNGIDTLILTTEQVGIHTIRVEVLGYGSAEIIVEGVE